MLPIAWTTTSGGDIVAIVLLGTTVGLLLGTVPGALLHRRRLGLRASGLQETLRRNGLARDEVARREERLLEARRAIEAEVARESRSSALEMLETKLQTRRREREALTVQLWRVAFERWANCIEPLLVDIESLSWEQIDSRRSIVDQALRLGESMQDQWMTEPTSQSAAGRRFLGQFKSALADVTDLRATLALRKASLADPDASRIPNQLPVTHVSRVDFQARITTLRGAIADDIERELAIFSAENDLEGYLKSGTS